MRTRALVFVGVAVCLCATVAFGGRITELLPPDIGPGDQFGWRVLVDGDRMYAHASLQSNEGAVYVYKRDPGAPGRWTIEARLAAPDPFQFDDFGDAITAQGDLLVVGAPGSNQTPSGGHDRVFVYGYDGGEWNLLTRLDPEPTNISFGSALALAGSTLIVGAQLAGDASPPFGTGAVHVYEGAGADWAQTAKIVASDGGPTDNFGSDVAFDGTTLVVGARYRPDSLGAAYFFERDGDRWIERDRVTSLDGLHLSQFGRAVAVDAGTAVIGSTFGAYVYERNPDGTWRGTAVLERRDDDRHFGEAVALTGNTAIVGAYRARFGFEELGAVSAFDRDFGGPGRRGLTFQQPGPGGHFGRAVAIDGETIAVGSHNKSGEYGHAGLVTMFETGPCALDVAIEPERMTPGGGFRLRIHLQHNRLQTVTVPFVIVVENAAGEVVHEQRTAPQTLSFREVVELPIELNVPESYHAGDYKVIVRIDEMRQGRALAEAWIDVR